MDLKAVDIDFDLSKQYEFIRKQLVKDDEALIQSFGPPERRTYEDEAASETKSKEREELAKRQKKQIQVGYTRMLSKVKKICQQFRETVNQGGLRSGSAKAIINNFDLLMESNDKIMLEETHNADIPSPKVDSRSRLLLPSIPMV